MDNKFSDNDIYRIIRLMINSRYDKGDDITLLAAEVIELWETFGGDYETYCSQYSKAVIDHFSIHGKKQKDEK
jgi:hypothetical protein